MQTMKHFATLSSFYIFACPQPNLMGGGGLVGCRWTGHGLVHGSWDWFFLSISPALPIPVLLFFFFCLLYLPFILHDRLGRHLWWWWAGGVNIAHAASCTP